MLRRKLIRHFTNDLDKSWTADDFLDLVVWYESTGKMFGFQLCYDRHDRPRAVTWTREGGFSHSEVRTDGVWALGAGMSPVLQSCNDFPWRTVLREFMTRSPELEPLIRLFIMKQIMKQGPKYSGSSP
jgi:hypothetical protein